MEWDLAHPIERADDRRLDVGDAEELVGADDELDRALHERAVGAVRIEDLRAQERRDHGRHVEVVLTDERGKLVDQFRFGIGIDEELEQLGGVELRCRRLLEEDVDDVVAVEVSGAAEERLRAVVVLGGVEIELARAPRERETGKGAGALAHVLFGVVADAQGEEFHQLAREIFVGMSFEAARVVEPL